MSKRETAFPQTLHQRVTTRNIFIQHSTSLGCVVALAAFVFLHGFTGDTFFGDPGRFRETDKDTARDEKARHEDRFILSVAGILDTRKARGLNTADDNFADQQLQWYVQTVSGLTGTERRELEADAGMKLGEYFPNNAYIVICSQTQAVHFAQARHVVWVGQRPTAHKIDPVLSEASLRALQQNGTLTWMKLDLFLFPDASQAENGQEDYAQFLLQSRAPTSAVLEVRALSPSQFILEMPLRDASRTIAWLSSQTSTQWIGKREMYSTRNYDSNKITTLGSNEQARFRTNDLLERNGLTGRGQMVAVSDTGLDFDHCMLWQRSFEWPCYEGFDQNQFNPICPASAYAAVLGNADFFDFVRSFLTTNVDIPLLGSGRAAGASNALPPLDIRFPVRTERIGEGYKFSIGDDSTIDLLLDAWSQVRPQLLPIFTETHCERCGGELEFVNGTTIFVPENDYFFDKVDSTNAVALANIGAPWKRLQRLMTEKCFCFFTIPTAATEDPLEAWKGVIPPLRELQDLAATPTAAITRKGQGLTALPYEEMGEMCNVTRLWKDLWTLRAPRNADTLSQITVTDSLVDMMLPGTSQGPLALSSMQSWREVILNLREPWRSRWVQMDWTSVVTELVDMATPGEETRMALQLLEGWKVVFYGNEYDAPTFYDRDEDGVLKSMCQDITFAWNEVVGNVTWNPCELEWDARGLETAMAKCFDLEYLKRPSTSTEEDGVVYVNTLTYTYSTTLAWWDEYSRIPPFNSTDRSRRAINAYYIMEGCAPCGMCQRLRIDSRDYPGMMPSEPMPAEVNRLGLLVVSLRPEADDWRLDSFEASNVDFLLSINVTAIAGLRDGESGLGTLAGAHVCLMTDQAYVDAPAGTVKHADYWEKHCLNGVNAGEDLDSSDSWTLTANANEMLRTQEFSWFDQVEPLERSADGWRLVIVNNSTRSLRFSAVMQLYTKGVECSDKLDGEALPAENTHSIGLGNTHVSSMAEDDICDLEGRTYCDGTSTSGRQLDECLVCGGSCFRPECTPELCLEHNPDMVRVRFVAEFPTGEVRKAFPFKEPSLPDAACPSPTSAGHLFQVPCEGFSCNQFNECGGRLERYKVDTHLLTVQAGEPYRLEGGQLKVEYTSDRDQMYALSARLLPRPDRLLRQGIHLDGEAIIDFDLEEPSPTLPIAVEGAGLTLRSDARFFIPAEALSSANDGVPPRGVLTANGTNFTAAWVQRDYFEASGNISRLPELLHGLEIHTPADAGTTRTNRQYLLRIQLKAVDDSGEPYRSSSGNPRGIRECPSAGRCECAAGWTGAACDTLARPLDIWVTVEPKERGRRVLPAPRANAGRRPTLNRDGHGTHVATSIVGEADDSEDSEPGASGMHRFDGLAKGAWLAFVDIGKSGNAYLTPPESLGEALMGRAYREAGARVMLHPWNCEDVAWWRKQDEAFGQEQRVARDKALHALPSICNRYTTGTWEVDAFVAQHPDLTVVFPAGNNGRAGERTVSAPGTCKNCLTVGISQGWPEALEASVEHALSRCRSEDCPQDVDKTETCAALGKNSPEQLPTCCHRKYDSGLYSPDHVDVPSGRGPTVSAQATHGSGYGDIFGDLEALVMRRAKPDVVAPGLNVVSGRSDGNPSSGGTYGKRCVVESSEDTSGLMTMSGSSQAAAKATAAAAIVRQYFAEGFYPSGIAAQGAPHSASAALVRAVLVASADVLPSALCENGEVEDLSWRVGPNHASGFGRVNIGNVLRMGTGMDRSPPRTAPEAERCECSGNNTRLWSAFPSWNATRGFPSDYGAECRAWHALPEGPKCDAMFPDNPWQRPSPYGAETYDLSCCMQWCFVDAGCPDAIEWDAVPGLYYSFSSCPETPDVILRPWTCEFGERDVRTIAKDHLIDGRPMDVEPPTFAESGEPLSGAIAEGESVSYVTYVMRATARHPLVVVMAYTDPPAALGSANVLVNDLDLEVTVTPVLLAGGQSLENSTRKLDVALTVVHHGNEVAEGDAFNNVERVRVVEVKAPSKVEARVTARRVVATAHPGGGPPKQGDGSGAPRPCQTFALVITGELEEAATSDATEVITSPSPLEDGICGRPVLDVVEEDQGLVLWLLAVITASSVCFCIACICLAYRCLGRRGRQTLEKIEDHSAPPNVGYMSRVQKVDKEYGVARGGGPDFIILGDNASDVDDFYCGLPIIITEGAGESEQSTITAYDGRTRKAEAEFDMGPSAGSKYAISHASPGAPMGYKVGEAGYIPITELPDADGQPEIYKKQTGTLSRARAKFGMITEKGLERVGIGRPKRVWKKKEEVQAVHAGIQIGKPVTSEDLYQFAMQNHSDVVAREAENSRLRDTPLQAQLKASYFDSVERLKAKRAHVNTNKEGLRGRNVVRKFKGTATNDAPPLKTLGGARQQGARGYMKDVEPEPSVISAQAGGVSIQTWDVEALAITNGNGHHDAESPDRPKPEEPRSGTKEEFDMVSATMLMGKSARRSPGGPGGNGNGLGANGAAASPRTPDAGLRSRAAEDHEAAGVALRTPVRETPRSPHMSGSGPGGRLTPAQKAKLIDDAFGPKNR